MKFTVQESKWLRGMKNGNGVITASMLENMQGDRCCMGFLAEACGASQDARILTAYLSSSKIDPFRGSLPEKLRPEPVDGDLRAHGPLAAAIYSANDNDIIDDAERKTRLTALFAAAGVEVEFVP